MNDYVKVILEVFFESKAILLQKISLGQQNESSASRLCWLVCKEVGLLLVQDSTQYFDRVCNPCGRWICNLGQFYQFIKAAITSTASTPFKSGKLTLDKPGKASPAWRKSRSVPVNSRAAKSPSIEGSTSATKGKSRKSLLFSLGEN